MKKMISLLLALVMLAAPVAAMAEGSVWYCPQCGRKNDDSFCPMDGTARPMDLGGNVQVKVGDHILFGTYPQSSRGTYKTPVEWVVLEVDGSRALVISRYGLDSMIYTSNVGDATWENSTLRTWLNDDFINKAFTRDEQRLIRTVTVDNSKRQGCSSWRTSGGNDTDDKVFLLSYLEAEKYFPTNDARMCVPTAYAVYRGAYVSEESALNGSACTWWWLRSPGKWSTEAANVYSSGWLGATHKRTDPGGAVRPAMWINIG